MRITFVFIGWLITQLRSAEGRSSRNTTVSQCRCELQANREMSAIERCRNLCDEQRLKGFSYPSTRVEKYVRCSDESLTRYLCVPPHRVFTVFICSTLGTLYNQPKLCPNASWNANAATFANISFNYNGNSITINHQNTLAAADSSNRIRIWLNTTGSPSRIINTPRPYPIGLFPISDDQILVTYYDYASYPYVDRWSLLNGTLLSSTLTYGRCSFLFVDINDDLYCSTDDRHMVTRKSWKVPSNSFTVVAGTGTGSAGSSPSALSSPCGIHVTTDLDLYVADFGNYRVQLFRAGQSNATTVAGSGSNSTFPLGRPMGITLDADENLYIVDRNNHRVVRVGAGGGGAMHRWLHKFNWISNE